MRRVIVALLLAALPLAGCLDKPAEEVVPESTEASADVPLNATLPEPIEDSQTVTGSADPLNFVGEPSCSAPTAQCFRYPFTLASAARVSASLAWGLPAHDFDLYVVQGDTDVLSHAATPPGNSESVEGVLEPGDYEVLVVGWAVTQDTFDLKAEFAAA